MQSFKSSAPSAPRRHCSCPGSVAAAVHSILDELGTATARSWQAPESKVRAFELAGGVEALRAHGVAMTVHERGVVLVELEGGRVERGPADWVAECLVVAPGGRLTLAEAEASYRVWLIGERLADPAAHPAEAARHALSSPPRSMNGDGKRYLRELGFKVKRKDGVSAFDGVALLPFEVEADVDETACLEALVGMALPAARASGSAHLCVRCGTLVGRPFETHVSCSDVRARQRVGPVTTRWVAGMGGLEGLELEREGGEDGE